MLVLVTKKPRAGAWAIGRKPPFPPIPRVSRRHTVHAHTCARPGRAPGYLSGSMRTRDHEFLLFHAHFLDRTSTFYDVYDVFVSILMRIWHFPSRLQSDYAFKAEMVTFLEGNCNKAGKLHFWLIWSGNSCYFFRNTTANFYFNLTRYFFCKNIYM